MKTEEIQKIEVDPDSGRVEGIEKREVEGYEEEYYIDNWRTWKCEMEMYPHDRYSKDWEFLFTLPRQKKEGKIKEEIVSFRYGHRLSIIAREIIYNELGEKIEENPLFTNMKNLNNMVKHMDKIKEIFKKKYKI